MSTKVDTRCRYQQDPDHTCRPTDRGLCRSEQLARQLRASRGIDVAAQVHARLRALIAAPPAAAGGESADPSGTFELVSQVVESGGFQIDRRTKGESC